MIVSYQNVEEFPGWAAAPEFFKALFARYGSRCILEVGSGANPTLAPEFVRGNGLSYITSDLDREELQKADSAFEQLVLDLSARDIDPALKGKFDCVLSRMVGEHISDGRQYHENIYKILRPGGISAHCFSTLWTLPFAVNRLMPEFLTDSLLNIFAPRNGHQHGKFKAYYSWSRGPSRSMITRFENLGFEVVSYTGYFGHGYYRKRLPALQHLENLKSKLLVNHPVPLLCSYATLILRKPDHATTQDRP
jgi:SAM-dependent methyltransferase